MYPYMIFAGGLLAGVVADRLYYKILRKATPEVEAAIKKRIELALKERGYEKMSQQALRDKRTIHDRVSKEVTVLLKEKSYEQRIRNAHQTA